MANAILPIILCGGSGTRLWPLSREFAPKPLLRLADGQSLLQKTWLRAQGLGPVDTVLTVTRQDLADAVDAAYVEIGASGRGKSMLLEPVARNTAPALAAAALWAQRQWGPDTELLVLAADHLIDDADGFAEAVRQARKLATDGDLITFGITPSSPETGFGYIAHDGHRVLRFVEKPALEDARKLCSDGRHVWNSGMFCMRAGAALRELACHAPQVLEAATAALPATGASTRITLDPQAFAQAPDISIDHALMERSTRLQVVVCDIGWHDVGCWEGFSTMLPPDASGNRVEGEVVLHGTRNCYVRSTQRLTALVGVDDLVVVDTPDALLVAHRCQAQQVRAVTRLLKSRAHETALRHREVQRPWGSYTVLEQGPRFKIKRLVVKPGCQLSLQRHHHRSEHWVVVSGTAAVCNGQQQQLVRSEESAFIRAGDLHRMGNPGVIDLVVIEVQCGDYLGEDDIQRLQDDYGRGADPTPDPSTPRSPA